MPKPPLSEVRVKPNTNSKYLIPDNFGTFRERDDEAVDGQPPQDQNPNHKFPEDQYATSSTLVNNHQEQQSQPRPNKSIDNRPDTSINIPSRVPTDRRVFTSIDRLQDFGKRAYNMMEWKYSTWKAETSMESTEMSKSTHVL